MAETITFEVTVTVDVSGSDARRHMNERFEQVMRDSPLDVVNVEDIGVDYPDGKARNALERAAKDLFDASVRALDQLRDVNPHPVRTIEALEAAIAKAKGGAR